MPDNRKKGEQALTAMEVHLRQHDWLAVSRYTIADIALYAYTHNADEAGFDLDAFPSTVSWLARVRSQPNHISQMEETSISVPKKLFD